MASDDEQSFSWLEALSLFLFSCSLLPLLIINISCLFTRFNVHLLLISDHLSQIPILPLVVFVNISSRSLTHYGIAFFFKIMLTYRPFRIIFSNMDMSGQ